MRRNLFIGVFYFLSAALVFGAADDSTRRFGIFVGSNNGGRERVTLRYAISDAVSVSKVFSEMGGIAVEDSVVLVEPSIRDINRRIDALQEQVVRSKGINKRTEIVFYYSGHSDEDGLLLNRERYPYRDLRDRINNIPSDMRIVILDSCASGAFTRLKGGAKTQPFLVDSSLTAEGYAFLTSSSANEASQESDRIAASYFTHSLVAGLRGAADSVGDGRVTLNELYRFAYAETLARTETSVYGSQHPSYDMQISGTGDVVLTDVKETSAGMVFDEKLTGRLSIRNSSDHLIAEITKTAVRPLELGLEPGPYYVTLQQGSDVLRSEFNLIEGQRTLVTRESFTFITTEPARRRGREDTAPPSEDNVYAFFVNYISEPFQFPLIGFVNIHRGSHNSAQVGYFNWNTKNFSGVQAGFVNTTGGNSNGIQAGFLNTTAGDTRGLQAAFVNTTVGAAAGVQAGFVNIAIKGMSGPQVGFVNTSIKEMSGPQLGFVNVAAQGIKGFQFGFVNYADSIEYGVPLGAISIVRKGGYHAVEYSFSEFYPIITGLKLGVDRLYTTVFAAYNPVEGYSPVNFSTGLGIGSIIPITKFFFINPEYNSLFSASRQDDYRSFSTYTFESFIPYFGFKFGKYFSITAGPSVTWVHAYNAADIKKQLEGQSLDMSDWEAPDTPVEIPKPLFSIYSHDFNKNNGVVVGARATVRFTF